MHNAIAATNAPIAVQGVKMSVQRAYLRTVSLNKVLLFSYRYNSVHPDGHLTYGGYADAVRVPSEFVFAIPEAISSAEAAPLLCAGTTVFAPLQRHMTPGCRVGVIGIGGLGHLALQFAKALGATEVVAITSSQKKVSNISLLLLLS